ncbi:non-classical arabinogalactan protein 31-like [Senna tora]|uniref:Non-classical arabinogalactan protein 31-like n=1 Tax=Senna tora TaxID=362788 RepID=A0A834SG57_9FABA|nr:non-classical arabinogalactan protein 31-like [Senna tora]
MASMQLPLFLFLTFTSSFCVFGEELDTLPPSSPHHPHPPTPAPAPAPHHHHHHHHHHPPAAAPVHPPSHTPTPTPKPSPAKPPVHHYPPPPSHTPIPTPTPTPTHPHYPPSPSPAKPPSSSHPFPRSFVAVQGVVYCKSCKYAGVDTLLGATPVLGAVVKLQCNNTRYPLVETAKSDKNGYFYLEAPKRITTFGAHKCKVFLLSSPNATCQKPSNLHGGVIGAALKPERPFVSYKLPFLLYTVGPLAFEPKCPHY